MKLGTVVNEIVGRHRLKSHDHRDIYAATRKLAGMAHWVTRPTPFYHPQFYVRRGRPVPEAAKEMERVNG